jgi:hypothetical protein
MSTDQDETGKPKNRLDEYVVAGSVACGFVGVFYAAMFFGVPIVGVVASFLMFPGILASGAGFFVHSDSEDLLIILSFMMNVVFWAWVVTQIGNYLRKKAGPASTKS